MSSLKRYRIALGAIALATVAALAGTTPVSGAAPPSDSGQGEAAPTIEGSARAYATRVGTPAQASPSDAARVEALPPFSWRPVRGAAKYEFQVSADGAFRSIVERGSYETRNTFGTIHKTLADGNYFWRTRAIDSRDRAGGWSKRRSIAKRWLTRPVLLGPAPGTSISYPGTPLVLRWQPVSYAYKYLVTLATDPSLATSLVGAGGKPVETQGTALAIPAALAPGTRYYWGVTPIDAGGHRGTGSAVGSFVWQWNSSTTPQVADVNAAQEVYDPKFSWGRVPGAARYEVEVSTSPGFAAGSKVCCDDRVIGTSLTPAKLLPNNDDDPVNSGYYWRVRAFDVNANPGSWNAGPGFAKQYDVNDPSVQQLRVRDNTGDPLTPGSPPVDLDPTTAYLDTRAPIVTWAPVPGASSYDVRVVPWGSLGCQWSTVGGESWGVIPPIATASTSWSALGPFQPSPVNTGTPPLSVENDLGKALVDGHGYCARVTARSGTDTKGSRVIGKSIDLGGTTAPAFKYRAPVVVPGTAPITMSADDYLQPAHASTVVRMPHFTWRAKAEACGYFVVVAKDQSFTRIMDVARTTQPSYAPRLRTYPDESTSYYWAVLPVQPDPSNPSSCTIVPTTPSDNSPRRFEKQSVAPALLEPAQGAQLTSQPAFRWGAAEGAREYRLEVSKDPNFQDGRLLLDDVTTAATAYTSSSTYPADADVYWRVRASDENGIGLNWSATRSFRRSLPVPAPGAGNPVGGEFLPVLSWPSVPGAVSYDLHVEQSDGTTRDFTYRSTAFTPILFYGTGVWRWQVRANFPGALGQTVPGGYSARRSFTRYIGAPTGARSTSTTKRLLVSWDPSRAARKYRVQFSESNSFSKIIDTADVENTAYAPRLIQPGFLDGGPIYWRVAAVDEGNNLGGWSTGQVKLLRRMAISLRGMPRRGRRGVVRVSVKDARGRAVRGARVTPRGAGVRRRGRLTGKRGTVRLKLRPRTRGTIRFRVDKRGFRPGSASVRVFL